MSSDEDPDPAAPALSLERVDAAGVPGDRPLAGLDLRLEAGQACLALGPRGSGVDTLLRLAAGRGRVLAGELEVAEPVFYLPSEAYMGPTLQVGELPAGMDLDDESFLRCLRELGVPGIRERTLGSLPTWAHARVGLAAALSAPASLLVLEEPFEPLDLDTEAALVEELQRCREQGQAQLIGSYRAAVPPLDGFTGLALEEGKAAARREPGEAPEGGWMAWYRRELE